MAEIKEDVKNLERRVDVVVASLAVASSNSYWTSLSIPKALNGDKTVMKKSLKMLEDMKRCARVFLET
jgi:hypothetical protein